MNPIFIPGSFADIAESSLGISLWSFLNSHDNILRMKTATFLRRPALEAVQLELLQEFGDAIHNDRCKQMIGRMGRQIMEYHGYTLDQSNVKISSKILFSSASRYCKK